MGFYSRILLYFSLLIIPICLEGQGHEQRSATIDVLRYHFEINLSDSADVMYGDASIEIRFGKDVDAFRLDLGSRRRDGSGMQVHRLQEAGKDLPFEHRADTLTIQCPSKSGEVKTFRINYSGVPSDGLIISKNRFGDRTFFGDNWPNRGRYWLPLVDHPSDKALVKFTVHVPGHYGVISNGIKRKEIRHDGWLTSQWESLVPLSSKLMVIGVSPFAVEYLNSASGVPVSSWVFPQNRQAGFLDYRLALDPLAYFEGLIAPYPYGKLANVQSRTRYGGMENAGCIFYHESSVTGRQDHEALLAHEIAHQWFGDGVSEENWHHIWLSEGFATYLTDLYLEHKYGREVFLRSMKTEKQEVLDLAKKRLFPIIDTTAEVGVRLLNSNTYEKAGWVLHMLRRELGDSTFRESLRAFYHKYAYANALTEDFVAVVDSVSERSLGPFFRQWLYRPGHPVLSYQWKYRKGQVTVKLQQNQTLPPFFFPLDIELTGPGGQKSLHTLSVSNREESFQLDCTFKPSGCRIDPDTWLFFEPAN